MEEIRGIETSPKPSFENTFSSPRCALASCHKTHGRVTFGCNCERKKAKRAHQRCTDANGHVETAQSEGLRPGRTALEGSATQQAALRAKAAGATMEDDETERQQSSANTHTSASLGADVICHDARCHRTILSQFLFNDAISSPCFVFKTVEFMVTWQPGPDRRTRIPGRTVEKPRV